MMYRKVFTALLGYTRTNLVLGNLKALSPRLIASSPILRSPVQNVGSPTLFQARKRMLSTSDNLRVNIPINSDLETVEPLVSWLDSPTYKISLCPNLEALDKFNAMRDRHLSESARIDMAEALRPRPRRIYWLRIDMSILLCDNRNLETYYKFIKKTSRKYCPFQIIAAPYLHPVQGKIYVRPRVTKVVWQIYSEMANEFAGIGVSDVFGRKNVPTTMS
jgi:hypothetical protein